MNLLIFEKKKKQYFFKKYWGSKMGVSVVYFNFVKNMVRLWFSYCIKNQIFKKSTTKMHRKSNLENYFWKWLSEKKSINDWLIDFRFFWKKNWLIDWLRGFGCDLSLIDFGRKNQSMIYWLILLRKIDCVPPLIFRSFVSFFLIMNRSENVPECRFVSQSKLP